MSLPDENSLWSASILLIGLGFAAVADVRRREVPDWTWIILGTVGVGLGVVIAPSSTPAFGIVLWLMVGFLAISQFVDWVAAVERRSTAAAFALDVAVYLVVLIAIIVGVARYGTGPTGVPVAVVAAFVGIVLARGLFELGVLWGGADAKALMAMSIVLPIFAGTLVPVPASASAGLAWIPFPITALVDALLATIAVPVVIALQNLRRHEFDARHGFTTFLLASKDLPSRFVWVHDPRVPSPEETGPPVESAEEDQAQRVELAARLQAAGIDRVRVSPQIPLVLFLAIGALTAVVAGNLVWDLIALV